MDNTKIKEIFAQFENWLSQHTHRDRLIITLLGFVIIYFIWYFFFEKPVLDKIAAHHQVLLSQQKDMTIFNNQIAEIKANAKIMLAKRKLESNTSVATKIPLASQKDNDIIIQTILTPQNNVEFIRLNNTTPEPDVVKPTMKNDLELAFSSNYFSTINYLSQLEKLPWCLSWDSLEYKVTKYPDALVVINLHIVNS